MNNDSAKKDEEAEAGPVQEGSRFSTQNQEDIQTVDALKNTLLRDDDTHLNQLRLINRRLVTFSHQLEDVSILQHRILEATDRLYLMQTMGRGGQSEGGAPTGIPTPDNSDTGQKKKSGSGDGLLGGGALGLGGLAYLAHRMKQRFNPPKSAPKRGSLPTKPGGAGAAAGKAATSGLASRLGGKLLRGAGVVGGAMIVYDILGALVDDTEWFKNWKRYSHDKMAELTGVGEAGKYPWEEGQEKPVETQSAPNLQGVKTDKPIRFETSQTINFKASRIRFEAPMITGMTGEFQSHPTIPAGRIGGFAAPGISSSAARMSPSQDSRPREQQIREGLSGSADTDRPSPEARSPAQESGPQFSPIPRGPQQSRPPSWHQPEQQSRLPSQALPEYRVPDQQGASPSQSRPSEQGQAPQAQQTGQPQSNLVGGAGIPRNTSPETLAALNKVAHDRGLNPAAVASVIGMESLWRTNQSTGSYRGLTQIGPQTFKEAGGRLAGMTWEEFQSAPAHKQIEAYGAWLDHYKIMDKYKKAGIDLNSMSAAKQAALLQGTQFAPNRTQWFKDVAEGRTNSRATNTTQARALGDTSHAAMEREFERRLSRSPAQYDKEIPTDKPQAERRDIPTAENRLQFSDKEQKARGNFTMGELRLPAVDGFEARTFRAGSGGGSRYPSVPYGSHDVSPTRAAGPIISGATGTDKVWHVGSKASNFQNIYDPKTGGTRTQIQIHQATQLDKLYSKGCIVMSPRDYPAFRAHMMALSKKHGSLVLDVAPSAQGKGSTIFSIRPSSAAPLGSVVQAEKAIENFEKTGHIDPTNVPESALRGEIETEVPQFEDPTATRVDGKFESYTSGLADLPESEQQATRMEASRSFKPLNSPDTTQSPPTEVQTDTRREQQARTDAIGEHDPLELFEMHPGPREYSEPTVTHPIVPSDRRSGPGTSTTHNVTAE